MLQAVDIYTLVGLLSFVSTKEWTQVALADYLLLSTPTLTRSLTRLEMAALWRREERSVAITAAEGVLLHGVRYFVPAVLGTLARGVPTAHSAPPLADHLGAEGAPVWPNGRGASMGISVTPLHAAAPEAALAHPELHELLAIVDSLRLGRARERSLAASALQDRLEARQ